MTPLQRAQQIGRIHAAKTALSLSDDDYRELLQSLTGLDSCVRLDDRQVNHVLDWLNYLSGRRHQQPLSFGRSGGGKGQVNLVRLCYAVRGIVPPGWTVNPLSSPAWQTRTAGRSCQTFEEFTAGELWQLIEGVKAIFRRAGTRGHETLETEPLSDGSDRGLKLCL